MKALNVRLILRHSLFTLMVMLMSVSAFAKSVSKSATKNTTPVERTLSSETKTWGVAWMMGLSSESEKSETQKSDSVGVLLGVQADQQWNKYLGFYGDIGAQLKSGQKDSIDGDKPAENAFQLYEASLGVGVNDGFKAQLGALDTHTNHSSLMFERRGTPGVRPQYNFVSEGQEFKIFAEVLAPQSHQIRSANGEKESFPTFISGGVGQKFRWSSKFESNWKVSSYQFQGLNQSVQNTSTFLGNTSAKGATADLAMLKYGFSGFEMEQTHRWLMTSHFLAELSGDYVMNSQAPTGRNTAYRGQASLTSVIRPKYHIVTEFEGFHIEPDAVLGAYSNTDYFNANRNGYRIGFGAILRNEKLKISASMIESQTIIENPPQTKEQLFLFRLETAYDKI